MEFKQIKELIEIFDNSGLCSLKLTQGDNAITLQKFSSKTPPSVQLPLENVAPSIHLEEKTPPPAASAAPKEIKGESLNSPMVGTFYRSPSPNAPAFVNIGDRVKKGQVLAIIEAMKIMNELEAECDCIIKDIIPNDGQAVEFGSPLFIVEKV